MGSSLNSIISFASSKDASDIHLYVGQPPIIRSGGIMTQLELPNLTANELDEFLSTILTENDLKIFEKNKEVDFAISHEHNGNIIRMRANLFTTMGNKAIVMRIINEENYFIDNIGLPSQSIETIKQIVSAPRGLILVTGPTGSGKSTTLSAIINYINENQRKHIITIEDPIEFIYKQNLSIITQRELGKDTINANASIVSALRQDPDVIMVGEMRDLETIEAAVTAAETGHLVLSTLHTTGSARTVNRIIDVFPQSSKELVKLQLASNLLCVISQVLCRRQNGSDMVAAFEIMTHTDSIANLIRENKTYQIQTELEMHKAEGMIPLDRHLLELYQKSVISMEEALSHAQNINEFKSRVGNAQPAPKKGLFSF